MRRQLLVPWLILFSLLLAGNWWFFSSPTLSPAFQQLHGKDFIHCSEDLETLYDTPFEGRDQKDKQWCQDTMEQSGLIIGLSWSSLPLLSSPSSVSPLKKSVGVPWP